ncbi:MAG TPA: VOC family protein [Caulobacteraceae bacterium]|nr:VOC family protein [Caulobacteraceae bacterium]
MRLRQVALIARQIAPVGTALEAVFGLKAGFRDPAVRVFGLANVVMPVGGEFLEVLEPIREDASGARYLARRGGDAGYMVILQASDALAHRARLEAEGVRIIAARGEGRYRFSHFHPADCAGVLLSIDSVEGADWRAPMSDWPPAGPDWGDFASEVSLGITAVTLQSRDPLAAAEGWSMLLDRPVTRAGDTLELRLDQGAIRFIAPVDDDGTGVVGLDVVVTDVAQVLANAARAGAIIRDDAVVICGTALRPVALPG